MIRSGFSATSISLTPGYSSRRKRALCASSAPSVSLRWAVLARRFTAEAQRGLGRNQIDQETENTVGVCSRIHAACPQGY